MPHHEANLPSTDPATWVDRYGDYLYRYAFFKTGDSTIAEDLVQEAFLAALKARKTFRSRSAVKTWLTAILRHKLMDYYRKKYRRRETSGADHVAVTPAPQFDGRGRWRIQPGHWVIDPAQHYEQKEFMVTFFQCVSDLPQRHARAFVMRDYGRYLGSDNSAMGDWVRLAPETRQRIKVSLQSAQMDPPDPDLTENS